MLHRTLLAILALSFLWTGVAQAAPTAPFRDLPPDHWSRAAVLELARLGIVTGDETGRFHPDRPITRAEWAKILVRARGLSTGPDCRGSFADVPCDRWFAGPVELAFRVAMLDGDDDDHFRPTAPLTRQEAATSLVRGLGKFMAADRERAAGVQALQAFDDAGEVAPWARPSLGWLVRHGLLAGRGDRLAPRATTTRAEAAVLAQRLLAQTPLPPLTAQVDGRPVRHARELIARATRYATGEPGVGTVTYSGLTVREGVVATDPDVIPLGTLMYVEGYGYAVAADIGGGVRGEHVDLYTDDPQEAAAFGIRPVRVFLLN